MRTYPVPFNEESRVGAIQSVPGLSPENEAIFDHLCMVTRRLFDCPIAHISVVDHDVQWYKSVVGIELGPMTKNNSFCTHAIMSDDLMVVPDLRADPRFVDHPMVADGGPGARFYAGVPLVLSSGHRFGSLCALDLKPHDTPSEEKLEILRELGKTVVAALERAPAEPAREQDETGPSAFVTLIGHELRTPLTVLLGSLSLIEVRSQDEVSKRLSSSTRKSAQHLAQLIETILQYCNAETGEMQLNANSHALDEIVSEILDAHSPLVSDAGKKAQSLVAPMMLDVDSDQFKLAITALVLNSLLHGGDEIGISTGTDEYGNFELVITDNGTLTPGTELAKLYEPFVVGGALDNRGSHGGLGLGLPLTRKIIELHGGEFQIRAGDTETSAVIRLPKWRVPPAN